MKRTIKTLASLLPCFILASCLKTYDSNTIPSTVQTSEITYRNVGIYPMGALITPDYANCSNLTFVQKPAKLGEGFTPKTLKTIKFPANTINTTMLNYIANHSGKILSGWVAISFKVKPNEHYYVDFAAYPLLKKMGYEVISIKNGIKTKAPFVKRGTGFFSSCSSLTKEEENLLFMD